ncbi:MOSC domain-containing protein [uncultured Friedmanniella sp.]|uniref:MOSC domain-containing protein n=1 Tax=uncultured Friedmanniella sp. TaxID=335381 RepID=UPI0035C98870
MSHLLSVNLGSAEPNPYKQARSTGIGKRPAAGPVEVRAPGPKRGGLGSGLVGDFIGDVRHHGGDLQAVYAFQREDLDGWQDRLGRPLANGFFGENLTTLGIDVNDARVGEVWRVGDTVELKVTSPRIPCSTFRGWMGEKGWAKVFSAVSRVGTYLSVLTPGRIQAGDPVEVVQRPSHDVTAALVFRAITTERHLLPQLLAAGDDLEPEIAEMARERRLVSLD